MAYHLLPHYVTSSFKPTPEMIEAAKKVQAALSYEAGVRQQVTGYKVRILAQLRPKVSRRWVILGEPDRVILDPAIDYLLSCKAAKMYYRRCTKAGRKLGYVFQNGQCPLLLAESATRDAQTELVRLMESVSGLTKDDLFCRANGLETYQQYILDSLFLLAPFY